MPLAPTLTWIDCPFAGPVSVAPTTVHTYVSIPPGPEYVFPVDPGHTDVAPTNAQTGFAFTVTFAVPDTVPVQFASTTLTRLYVVATPGVTVRVHGLTVIPLSTRPPSAHVIVQGPLPVSATCRFAEAPGQMLCVPVSVAVGNGFTVTVTVPLLKHPVVPSVTFTVYTVVAPGVTVIAAVVAPPGLHR